MVGVYVGEAKKEKKKTNQWTLCWKCFTWMGVVFFGDGGGREGGGVLICLGDRVLCTTMKNTGQSDASI